MYWIFFFFFGKDAFLALDSFFSFLNSNRGSRYKCFALKFLWNCNIQVGDFSTMVQQSCSFIEWISLIFPLHWDSPSFCFKKAMEVDGFLNQIRINYKKRGVDRVFSIYWKIMFAANPYICIWKQGRNFICKQCKHTGCLTYKHFQSCMRTRQISHGFIPHDPLKK